MWNSPEPPLQGKPTHQRQWPQSNKLPLLVSILGFPLPFPFSVGFVLFHGTKETCSCFFFGKKSLVNLFSVSC
jgi:hypothetical protein